MQTTRPDERMVPPGICACQVRISEEEVSDFCSVLSPADRVFVVGSADTATVARLFRLSLDDLGFVADLLDTATVCRPADQHRRRDRGTTGGWGPGQHRGVGVRHAGSAACRCDASESDAAPPGRCRRHVSIDGW
jgi:hypothetical protein